MNHSTQTTESPRAMQGQRDRALIIEDDEDIAMLIKFNLEGAGLHAEILPTGRNAVKRIKETMPDIVLLDLMLPEVDGIEICRRLRQDQETSPVPVLMITAKGTEPDRIRGFESGADDYIVKPFSPREMVLRVKAILARGRGAGERVAGQPGLMAVGPIQLDTERFKAFINTREVELTATEFKLLRELIRAPGKVRSRETLLEEVWQYNFDGYARTVDTHVRRLRIKLGEAAEWIETVRGVGYRFREPR